MTLEEGLAFVQNPECEGGSNCRCLAFFELKEGA
jgi:hypothetical protein